MISGRRREPSDAATSAAMELAGEAEEPDIEGADAGGTTSDLLVGDKEEVRARREACRRKQKALRSEAEEEEDALIEVLDALVESVQKPSRLRDGRAGGDASLAAKRPSMSEPVTKRRQIRLGGTVVLHSTNC